MTVPRKRISTIPPWHIDAVGGRLQHQRLVDVAYGGNFYAIVDPQKNFRDMADFTSRQLVEFSLRLRKAINRKYEFIHPEHAQIRGLSHVQWTGAPRVARAPARNAVLYGDNAID